MELQLVWWCWCLEAYEQFECPNLDNLNILQHAHILEKALVSSIPFSSRNGNEVELVSVHILV